MSLLGLDVGATGCKASAYSLEGVPLAEAYREYGVLTGPRGLRELDSRQVWAAVRSAIRQVASQTRRDPIQALSVASLPEAMVPLSADGRMLGNSILGLDQRGQEYARQIEEQIRADHLYAITGNVPGAFYSLTKLCWLRDNQPELFSATWRFMPWSGLVCSLLGGSSLCDYSLASRTLLFDIRQERWSRELLRAANLPEEKLPKLAPAGTPLGTVSAILAKELDLPSNVRLVLGGHDQCCNALGAGVTATGQAIYCLGSYLCLTPTFQAIPLTSLMLGNGLNMEHHVVPGLLVSFLYNPTGGAILKWFRDTLMPMESREAQKRGSNIYDIMLAEMPSEPTSLMVLPHFAPTGPPSFDAQSAGALLGLKLDTTRGEIVRALLEGITYYIAEGCDLFEAVGIRIGNYRVTGGGARSDRWVQLTADILDHALERPRVIEAGTLGAALLAGVGAGYYANMDEAARAAVRVQRVFEPDARRHAIYRDRLARYRPLYPLLKDYLHGLYQGS